MVIVCLIFLIYPCFISIIPQLGVVCIHLNAIFSIPLMGCFSLALPPLYEYIYESSLALEMASRVSCLVLSIHISSSLLLTCKTTYFLPERQLIQLLSIALNLA
jgi:hypothetical protein